MRYNILICPEPPFEILFCTYHIAITLFDEITWRGSIIFHILYILYLFSYHWLRFLRETSLFFPPFCFEGIFWECNVHQKSQVCVCISVNIAWISSYFTAVRLTSIPPPRVPLRLWPGISLAVFNPSYWCIQKVPKRPSWWKVVSGFDSHLTWLTFVFPRVTPPCWIVAVGTPRSRRSSWPAPMMGEFFFRSLSYCCLTGVSHICQSVTSETVFQMKPFIWNAIFL